MKCCRLLVIGIIALVVGCENRSEVKMNEGLSTIPDAVVLDQMTISDMTVKRDASPSIPQDAELDLELPDLEALDVGLDADPSAPVLESEFVMNEIELLASETGFDLNDDGVPNNGLALLFEDPLVGQALGGNPNEFIARSVRRGELLLLLDFRQLNDFVSDVSFNIDLFLGRDTDGRRRNNFNGEESFFMTCSSLTESGEPESRFEDVTLIDGEIDGSFGQFRFLVSFSDTEVLLRNAKMTGMMSADGLSITNGRLGGAVTFSDLEEVVRNDPEIGPEFAQIMLGFLNSKLDIDLDGDGRLDALSASFRFEAVRAIVERDLPCVD